MNTIQSSTKSAAMPCSPPARTYPATLLVDTPSGPVAMCKSHAAGFKGLMSLVGASTNTTTAPEGSECAQCASKARDEQETRAQRPAQQQGIAAKGWCIIAATAAILFLIFHPWPHYQWALSRDKVSSYDGFVARFPSSDYTLNAKERIRELREDEIWSAADGAGKIETLRSYIRVYPDGKHLDDAKQQTASIADSQWTPISNSRSEAEIRRYLKSYPETSKLAMAEARIQELYNDFYWVKEQDTLEHYRRFATRHPTHTQIAAIEKRIIDLEVKEIAAGKYGAMPRAQALSYGGTSTVVEVENKTGYELTVRYSGPDSKKLVIPVGATRSINLVPGAYQVAASVDAANVTNYYGSDTMQGGRYSSNFFIQSSYDRSSF